MASSPVHRGLAVVIGTTVSGMTYTLAGVWSSGAGTTWNGYAKGEVTYTPDAEVIQHRDPLTGAVAGATYFNQSKKVSLVFVPGADTNANAITASQVDILPGSQFRITSSDPLMGSSGDADVAEIYQVETASRVHSTTGECVWNLSLAQYNGGVGLKMARVGDVAP